MWVRLDDAYYDHAKIVAAGPLAELLWVRALAWANRNRTRTLDGIVPAGVVYRLADFTGRTTLDGGSVSPSELVEALVNVGLWHPVDAGYAIHDYTEYQRTLDELDELSAKRSAAGVKGAKARWGKPDGESHSNGMASAIAGDGQTDAPVPSPKGSLPSVRLDTQVAEALWTEYARLKRADATGRIRNFNRYDRRTIENAKADGELVERAARWLTDFDVTAKDVAQALVAGKASPYWTRRSEAS